MHHAIYKSRKVREREGMPTTLPPALPAIDTPSVVQLEVYPICPWMALSFAAPRMMCPPPLTLPCGAVRNVATYQLSLLLGPCISINDKGLTVLLYPCLPACLPDGWCRCLASIGVGLYWSCPGWPCPLPLVGRRTVAEVDPASHQARATQQPLIHPPDPPLPISITKVI